MSYWAYGNKVVFISSRKESFGFVVESAELRQMLKAQFDLIWEMSQPLTDNIPEMDAFLETI